MFAYISRMSSSSRLTAEDVRRVEDAVRKHPLPPFVIGFDVEYGDDHDGDPACWITFQLVPNNWPLKQRVEALQKLTATVRADLTPILQDRWPYFHLAETENTVAEQAT